MPRTGYLLFFYPQDIYDVEPSCFRIEDCTDAEALMFISDVENQGYVFDEMYPASSFYPSKNND